MVFLKQVLCAFGGGMILHLLLDFLDPLHVLGWCRTHPEDKLGPEVPEDVVEEGDWEQEDGEQPSLPDNELEDVHF